MQRPPQSPASVPATDLVSASSHAIRESYRQVIALVVYFEDLSVHTDLEVRQVVDGFRGYDYFVVEYRLPQQDPTHDFLMKLRSLQDHISKDTLLIIYYCGHGCLGGRPDDFLRFTSESDTADQISWIDIYPRILSIDCDVLTFLDCCHSGGAALSPFQVEAVNTVHKVDWTFSKEVITTAGFQSVCWFDETYSLSYLLNMVLSDYAQSGKLDSSILFNEFSSRMKDMYKEPPTPVFSRKRKRYSPEPTPTNPVRYVVVHGRSGKIALKPLAQPLLTRDLEVANRFYLYGSEFTSAILAIEKSMIETEYWRIREARNPFKD